MLCLESSYGTEIIVNYRKCATKRKDKRLKKYEVNLVTISNNADDMEKMTI